MIRIELLSESNFCLESLDLFNRKQNVTKVYRKIYTECKLIDCKYIEDWNLDEKRSIARRISSSDYIAYLSLDNDKVVGFIGLLKKLNGPYMILDMLHVSNEYRGQGVGRQLFEIGKKEARKAGAKALYISACSSFETVEFYKRMGSFLTNNPIKEMVIKEPFDLQMICPVKG